MRSSPASRSPLLWPLALIVLLFAGAQARLLAQAGAEDSGSPLAVGNGALATLLTQPNPFGQLLQFLQQQQRAGDVDGGSDSPAADAQDEGDGLRIVGGEVVENPNRHPYMASLRDQGRHFCGGALVAPRAVVTAAHCMVPFGSRDLPEVHVGRYIASQGQDNTRWYERRCRQSYVHPDWTERTGLGDIALCILDEAVTDIQPVEVAPGDLSVPLQSIPLTVLGWGATREGGQNTDGPLRSVDVYNLDRQACNRTYSGQIRDTQMCAGLVSGGADACQGDSGGPMILQDEPSSSNTQDVLVGLVSYGSGCGDVGRPGVYTRLASYRGWINQRLQDTCARPSLGFFCGNRLDPLPPSSMTKPYFDPNGPPSAPIDPPDNPPSIGFGFGPFGIADAWQNIVSLFGRQLPFMNLGQPLLFGPATPPESPGSQAPTPPINPRLAQGVGSGEIRGQEQECACSLYGISGNAADIPYRGCKQHSGESNPHYCYVEGGVRCDAATPSSAFPSAAWRGCDPDVEKEEAEVIELEDKQQRSGGDEESPSGKCACSLYGISGNAADIPYRGCKQHSGESNPHYCYVEGGVRCDAATPSSAFPSAAWRECDPDVEKEEAEVIEPEDKQQRSGGDEESPSGKCACSLYGISGNAADIPYRGCKQHSGEGESSYCYVEGGVRCDAATPSSEFPSAAWRECDPDVEKEGGDGLDFNDDGVKEGSGEIRGQEDECACSLYGISGNAADIPYRGCKQHSGESESNYCYVEGGVRCDAATPSSEFPSAAWRECDPDVERKGEEVIEPEGKQQESGGGKVEGADDGGGQGP